MKNKISILFSALVLFAFQSCTKMQNQNITVTQTVSAKISANETYSFTLPANVSSHDFQITIAANHSIVSEIQKDANGNSTFIYTPVLNYTGADQITLSTVNETETDMHNGNCNGGNHDGDNVQEGDQSNDNNNEGDNNDGNHHDGNHHDSNHHDKNHEHGHQDAEKNMVITINLTVTPTDNSRH